MLSPTLWPGSTPQVNGSASGWDATSRAARAGRVLTSLAAPAAGAFLAAAAPALLEALHELAAFRTTGRRPALALRRRERADVSLGRDTPPRGDSEPRGGEHHDEAGHAQR